MHSKLVEELKRHLEIAVGYMPKHFFLICVNFMVVYVSCLSLCLIILLVIFPTCLLSALDTRSKKISQPEKELYAFPLGKCIRVFRSKLQRHWV